jgi:peptidoglycan/xylan/chitin deacetylase (PgdA/CDA1 family)
MPGLKVVPPAGRTAERTYVARVVLGEWLGLAYELHEARPAEQWEFQLDGSSVAIDDTLFRDVFEHLTRAEELEIAERDEHGRFPAHASRSDLESPVADLHTEAIWDALRETWPRLERRRHEFRVVPSHDVDYPFASLRLRAPALKRGEWRAALPQDPFDTFDLLMDASERRGLRAAFYFLADGSIYSLDDPRIRRLLRRVHDRGHEIGLHGGYGTFRDAAQLKRELDALERTCAAEAIEQDVWGGRQHFLRWQNPTTWRVYEEVGLAYDTSLGFSARPGFRAGTCREYPVFDLEQRRELRLRERPLVLMDTPTLDRLGLPDEELVALIERLRRECTRFGGNFTVLWHNNWLVTGRQRRLLEAALGPVDR